MALFDQTSLGLLVEEIEAQGLGWEAGRNSLFGLSDAELLLRLGLSTGPEDEPLAARSERAEQQRKSYSYVAPASHSTFDWRNTTVGGVTGNWTDPIGDQGSCGSGVAFGVGGTLGSRARVISNTRAAQGKPPLLSPAYLFYCIAEAKEQRTGTGWWPSSALQACISKGPGRGGVPLWNFFPYTAGDQKCGVTFPWQGWGCSWVNTFTDVADMKTYLGTHGPLVGTFAVYSDFFAYKSGVYRPSHNSSIVGYHCVSVVGFNDKAGAWICNNSWGTAWGEHGSFEIAYGVCDIDNSMLAADGIVQALS